MVFNGERNVLKKYPSRNPNQCTFTYEDFDVHHCASVNDSWKLRKLFKFSKHKDVNLQDDDFGGRSALHIACQKGHIECCEILLENGADPTLRMYDGWTPAHCAAEIGNIEVLKLLIRYSGTVVAKDDAGATPRHIAKTYGHKDCATFLKAVEEHPSQKQEIIRDRIQNAARRTLLKIQKE